MAPIPINPLRLLRSFNGGLAINTPFDSDFTIQVGLAPTINKNLPPCNVFMTIDLSGSIV